MATQVQIRRGTTAGHSSFTGAIAELTFDTDLKTVRAHDGTVAGGRVLATVTHVSNELANLISSAPATLDTLNEIALALNSDNNFAATVITQLGNKANTTSLTTANVAEVTNLYYTNARVYSAVTGNLALKANLTDKLNVFGSTTSAELASVISDETGTGNLVFNASPTFTGTVSAAEINATGNVTSPFFYSQSDINLKKDLVPITDALNIVKSLDGYRFKWKKNDADSFGLIAQHVESVLPMLIGTSPDGSKTVLYNGIIAILLEAIKEQQVQIDEIKVKLNENI
jgi:hypothetical protein